MEMLTVIEDLDVIEDGYFRLRNGQVVLVMDQLLFEGSKEAFHGGIVVTITRLAHADLGKIVIEQLLVACAGILTTPVRMVQEM